MKTTYKLVLASSLVFQLSVSLTAQTLADIARESRAKRQSATGARVITGAPEGGQKKEPGYKTEIQALMARSAFAELDAAADRVRASKERVEGGAWKLFVFYETVSNPNVGGAASSTDWIQHITRLEGWVAARPKSVTARVALAEAYRLSGWSARGSGFADKVTSSGAQEFQQQGDMAFKTLAEAGELPTKCPHWYFVMLEVARDQGWKPELTRGLFERAIAFEPGYYHYHREYAYNLLPKWNGQPGDAEKFADESYRRIGGRQGAFVYFEIASVLYCMCNDGQANPTMEWPTIKEGFAEMEERYGATTTKLNRFALLAYLYRDRDVARRTLDRVGDQWEPTLWRQLASFNTARTWAGLPNL